MKDEQETGTDCYIDPKFFFNHSSTSFSSRLGCSTVGPSAASWFSHWHPLSNWPELPVHLVILLFNAHLIPLFFHSFSQVHLLIDGSVEGQCITYIFKDIFSDTKFNDSDKKSQSFIHNKSKSIKYNKLAFQFRSSLNRAKSRISNLSDLSQGWPEGFLFNS